MKDDCLSGRYPPIPVGTEGRVAFDVGRDSVLVEFPEDFMNEAGDTTEWVKVGCLAVRPVSHLSAAA
jgi:hypothetical protein